MKNFGTAINCMDGRVQEPVIEYLKGEFKVEYVDMITEPGPNKILAENKEAAPIASIKARVDISTGKHGSNVIAIVGHHDCAGNPVDEKKQIEDIKLAVKNVEAWNLGVTVIGLYLNEEWKVTKVC